jgi:polysaccharide pyruvyl transferase CsaB
MAGSTSALPSQRAQRVVISGYYGAINVGDEAVCRAVVEGIRGVLPGSQFDVVTANELNSRGFGGLDTRFLNGFYPTTTFWQSFPDYLRALRQADVCIVGGGGIFQDVHSWKSSCRHLITASLATAMGRPVVTVGLGVGPVERQWLRRLIGWVSSGFAVIQVRDEYSRRVLAECGVAPEVIRVTADVVPSLPLPPRRVAPSVRLDRIGFAMRRWPDLNEAGLVELWERLAAQGRDVWLLCYEPEKDAIFYEELLERTSAECRARIRVHRPASLDDAIQTLGTMDGVVSMRLHGCVFSAAAGIPFIAVPYDPKVASFADAMGCGGWQCALEEVGPDCGDRLQAIASGASRQTELLTQRFEAIRESAAENFSSLPRALHARPGSGKRLRALSCALVLLAMGSTSVEVRRFVRRRARTVLLTLANRVGLSAGRGARHTKG